EPRIPNMRGIMAARTKPLKVVPATDATPLTEIIHYYLPPAKTGVKLFTEEQVADLVQALHSEAKVI
ncbi:MAG: electron transfer flavoprotein beta subunit/FixA family protein, partial [Chitinophagaceae bacterium]